MYSVKITVINNEHKRIPGFDKEVDKIIFSRY